MKPLFSVPSVLRRAAGADASSASLARTALSCVFCTDTTFLQGVQRELTRLDAEEAALVGGVQLLSEHTEVLSIPTSAFLPKYTSQSERGLEADRESVSAICRVLEENGQRILARFHSHPGPGIGMCQPSERDIKDQMDWEQGGSLAVSGIFTRSQCGTFFVRFFTVDNPVTVRVIGRAIPHGSNTWEILDEPSL